MELREELFGARSLPNMKIEHMYIEDDKPGISFYRFKHGQDILFVGSDGSIEGATTLSEDERNIILKDFNEYLNSEDGKENITAMRTSGE